VPTFIINSASGASVKLNTIKRPNLSISTACATGLHSIGESYRMIQYDDADLIFAVALKQPLQPLLWQDLPE